MGFLKGALLVVLLAAAVVAGWILRDRWQTGRAPAPSAADIAWESGTPEGAQRARDSVQRLVGRDGPAFVRIRPGDLTAYVLAALPPSSADVQAAVVGEEFYVKALVPLSDIGGTAALGPLGGMLSGTEPVEIRGTFRIVKPGLAEYRVGGLKIRDLSAPAALLPRLARELARGNRPEGVSDDGLPFEVPPTIGDVRLMNGRVVLYRATP